MPECGCGFDLLKSLRLLSAIASGMMQSDVQERKRNVLGYIGEYMTLKPRTLNEIEIEIAKKYGDDLQQNEYYLEDCPTGITDKVIKRLENAESEREIADTLEGIIAIMVNQANVSLKLCEVKLGNE